MTLLATVFDLDDVAEATDLIATAAELGPVGLVSASPRQHIRAAMSEYGLTKHLQAIVSGDDVTTEPYLLAARKLRVEPAQCLAVVDSPSGIRDAHAAGMTVLAAPDVTAKVICQVWVKVYTSSR